jgi:hypothetical protein
MTRDEAVKKCRKALLDKLGYPETADVPKAKETAENVVTCLEALGLLKLHS